MEDRTTPATSGVAWPDPTHLTLSFAPDGTSVSGAASDLARTLDAVAPRAVWQAEIVRAFHAWADRADITLRVRDDGGQPLGTPGAAKGDPRFGDIRVAGRPLPAGTLVTNSQFLWSGSTWSGDVVVNTAYRFTTGGGATGYDLYSAMLSEAGNVFGVVDSRTDPTSAVYYRYVGPRAGLSAADVADIQSLYGPPAAGSPPAGVTGRVFHGTVTAVGGGTFAVRAPAGAARQRLNAIVWTTDPGLAAPVVEVRSAAGAVLPARVLGNDGGTFSVELDDAVPGAAYSLRVNPHLLPGLRASGAFTLAAGFTGQPATGGFDSAATGRVGPAAVERSLTVDRNEVVELSLAATGGAVRLDVVDAAGRVLATVAADPGQPLATAHVYLPAGGYTLRFSAVRPGPAAGFEAGLRVVSDPIGPAFTDEPDDGPGRPKPATPEATLPAAKEVPSAEPVALTAWDQPYTL